MPQDGTPHPGEQHQWESDPATATTSIGLPDLGDAPVGEHQLDEDNRAAVNALPIGSGLLVAHAGPNQGARFLLDQDVTTVGRHPNADIFLDDVTVSRKHAEFRRSGTGFLVADAGSLNGTYVNHDRVDSVVLRSGMEVQIGKFRLTYYAGTQHTTA
ncbi:MULTISPECIES: FHA domain-containing protein [Micrococcus]|uniref:Forkhead associated (FHA) domain, binds pSer, pThr, pTyr n=1 Tax=Micrococcus terreus TaxID=574650 RepID=A0A1I7ML02_9MICC|nr:FHA domain-containing protein [Micrococcus terreus]MDK7701580.1 FHA domain-containing protein [Micrococcus terreus]WOO98538.1 FHA domain-containing protein [Micrococcus terreus]SFV22578.1 Forkhead associated (FHA) domain, binds pSer, pThr, pTyr [Micrococcus terreus]